MRRRRPASRSPRAAPRPPRRPTSSARRSSRRAASRRSSPGMSVGRGEAARARPPRARSQGRARRARPRLGVSDVALDGARSTAAPCRASSRSSRATARATCSTRAWGPPQIAHDSLGQPEVTWASESTGWKVKLDCLERNCLVEYSPYHVLTAEFFGAHVVPPGDLAKLRIGMKLADARALAPGSIAARAGIPTERRRRARVRRDRRQARHRARRSISTCRRTPRI